jgi:hypothetical protein
MGKLTASHPDRVLAPPPFTLTERRDPPLHARLITYPAIKACWIQKNARNVIHEARARANELHDDERLLLPACVGQRTPLAVEVNEFISLQSPGDDVIEVDVKLPNIVILCVTRVKWSRVDR